MRKIFVAGSINMDIVAQTKSLPKPGETLLGKQLHYIPGGKGSNQAVAASRLGGSVYLIGKLGHDPFGEALYQFLSGENLNLDYLGFSDDQPSGVAIILVDEASENSIIVLSGSNYDLHPADVKAIPLEAEDVVVSVFEIPQDAIYALFSQAKAVQAKTILNPAPANTIENKLLSLVDVLIVNETELAFYAGTDALAETDEIIQVARALQKDPEQIIIVTLGAKGLVCIQGETIIKKAAPKVKAIDTTGAGDCFTGSLAVAFSEGMPLEKALEFAMTSSALSVQTLGASSSMPKRDHVNKMLKAYF
ncbi:ribokinase [Anaerolineales bacterium]